MSRTIAEDCLKLSTQTLKRLGFLTGDWFHEKTLAWTTPQGATIGSIKVSIKPLGNNGCIEITHTTRNPSRAGTGIITHYMYEVGLTTTRCNYGEDGKRYWFLCPMCNRRVGTVYKPPGELYFGCRTCYNLSYASRNVSHTAMDRLLTLWLKSGGSRESW